MTQKEKVRQHLERGLELTPLQALLEYGTLRLASLIFRLKQEGMDIVSNIIHDEDTDKHYASYHIRYIRR